MADLNKPLNKLAFDINCEARANGWYKKERTPLEIHMLIVSEIAEATEEVRNGRPLLYKCDRAHQTEAGVLYTSIITPSSPFWENNDGDKLEGEAVEIVDALIRILDYCAHRNIDVDALVQQKREYNKTRGERHGGKLY